MVTLGSNCTHFNALDPTFTKYRNCLSSGSGIVTGFYLSSDEGDKKMDEIDFEFVANNKTYVQTNYFVSGYVLRLFLFFPFCMFFSSQKKSIFLKGWRSWRICEVGKRLLSWLYKLLHSLQFNNKVIPLPFFFTFLGGKDLILKPTWMKIGTSLKIDGCRFMIDGKIVREASGFTKRVYLYIVAWWGGDPYWVGEVNWVNAPYYFQVSRITIT